MMGSFFLLLVSGCATTTVKPKLFYIPDGSITMEYAPGLRVTAYAFPQERAKAAVIFIHGGGWQKGGSELPLYSNWEPLLLANGIRAFSIEHRTAPEFRGPDLIEDVKKAIKFIQQKHKELSFPEDRISLIGFSSGGHLALMAALQRDPEIKIHSVAAFYPPLDLEYAYNTSSPNTQIKKFLNAYIPENKNDHGNDLKTDSQVFSWRNISPIEALRVGNPPILLIQGQSDTLVTPEHSIRFINKANELGIHNIRLIPVPGANHSFDVSQSQWARNLEAETVRFILE
jgi:acetyl esterase/lipase